MLMSTGATESNSDTSTGICEYRYSDPTMLWHLLNEEEENAS
jgi:hypothetical protein